MPKRSGRGIGGRGRRLVELLGTQGLQDLRFMVEGLIVPKLKGLWPMVVSLFGPE